MERLVAQNRSRTALKLNIYSSCETNIKIGDEVLLCRKHDHDHWIRHYKITKIHEK